jgi:membrane protein insertase Oxa1/YidC/SpoIIIJ
MATLVPDQQSKVDVSIKSTGSGADLKYQIDYVAPGKEIAPGATAAADARLFAGAKIVKLIDAYEKKCGIEKFDLTIDWGWFWFFTKPLFWLLEWLYGQLGNFGVAILVLTVLVKAVFFPLANKSYAAIDKMKRAEPEMEAAGALQEDRQRMNRELMQLYRREGEPGSRLPAHRGADPGVLRPLQGALHHHRDAPSAILRLDQGPERARPAHRPDRLRPVPLAGAGFLHFFNIGL